MSSGLLDVERRVQKACLESLKAWAPLTALVAVAKIVEKRDASGDGGFPSAYVEANNFAEYGLHTGNYLGGIRCGGMTYMDDDLDMEIAKQILGAFRSWGMQTGLKTVLNNTTSAQTAGSEVWFFAVENDIYGDGGLPAMVHPGERSERAHEVVFELTAVCMPSRP